MTGISSEQIWKNGIKKTAHKFKYDEQPLTFQKIFPFTIRVKLPQLHMKPGKPDSARPSGLRLRRPQAKNQGISHPKMYTSFGGRKRAAVIKTIAR